MMSMLQIIMLARQCGRARAGSVSGLWLLNLFLKLPSNRLGVNEIAIVINCNLITNVQVID